LQIDAIRDVVNLPTPKIHFHETTPDILFFPYFCFPHSLAIHGLRGTIVGNAQPDYSFGG
jgi:hypothetical protein